MIPGRFGVPGVLVHHGSRSTGEVQNGPDHRMTPAWHDRLSSIEATEDGLQSAGYIASRPISTAVYLAHHLTKPILVEGPAGVGKTELAKAAASWLGLGLIRMQCYEGLDESKALYEWKYGKQLLYTQILKDRMGALLGDEPGMDAAMRKLHGVSDLFFSEEFLEPRPLLKALREPEGAVLLIDEVDKADQEFEAFLLEILSDYQVSIPEIGTVRAKVAPIVMLTSNSMRDLGDALKRRCLHLHIGLPDARLEARIIASRVPGVEEGLRRQLVAFVQQLRTLELKKLPSVSETIDWARVLVLLHSRQLEPELVRSTLNVLLKFESDIETVEPQIGELLQKSRREAVPVR
jgi:MoxR-like ATPase